MLITALFTIAKIWKEPKHPLTTNEWKSKMCYTHTMGYYSALKKEENPVICYNMDEC